MSLRPDQEIYECHTVGSPVYYYYYYYVADVIHRRI